MVVVVVGVMMWVGGTGGDLWLPLDRHEFSLGHRQYSFCSDVFLWAIGPGGGEVLGRGEGDRNGNLDILSCLYPLVRLSATMNFNWD